MILIGFIFIYSSSYVYALERCGSAHYFVKKQIIGVGLGLLACMFFRFTPLWLIKLFTPLFFWTTLTATALTLFSQFGTTIHGSSRWLNIFLLTFQPSELLKTAFIMYCASILSSYNYKKIPRSALFYILSVLALLSFILLKQPDFGMAVTISISTLITLFILSIHTYYILLSSIGMSIISACLIYARSYRWKRITTFFNPWSDPQGAGFQLIQSLIAIGSGNLFGVGISHSKQKFFYLPMQHTDFIVAIIAEETGLLGTSFLILLYIAFTYFGLRIACNVSTIFSACIIFGFVIMTNLQALINIAVTTGLLPTKGIGLPFISYGNSSLIASLCLLGLIINCVTQEKKNNHS